MKYRVGASEKVTKDGKDYRVWKVSEQAGFFLEDGIEGEAAEAMIDKIIASCSALAVKMDAEACAADELKKAVPEKDINGDSIDNVSEKAQKQANMSAVSKNNASEQNVKSAYLLRKRTGEKIVIDKDVFKLGKDVACVDYVVDDNPTISRNHADIIRKKGVYYVKDKGSLNHTFVDGKKLEAQKPVKLESGSFLQLADEVFEWKQE